MFLDAVTRESARQADGKPLLPVTLPTVGQVAGDPEA